MKRNFLPIKEKKCWAITTPVWGLLPYSINETRSGAIRSVSATPTDWRNFKNSCGYKCIEIVISVNLQKK